MAEDIFKFWSKIRKGQKIHPADEPIFHRIDARRHGFRLECLPGSYSGRLRTAPVVLLYLSLGFGERDLADAKDEDAREYYFQKQKGNTPFRDASFRRLRGPTYIAAICDEAAFWYSDEFSDAAAQHVS